MADHAHAPDTARQQQSRDDAACCTNLLQRMKSLRDAGQQAAR